MDMAFSSFELAAYGSQPILLFEFTRDTLVYRYTAADRTLTVGDEQYVNRAMSCGEIRQSGDDQTDEFTITAPGTLPMVEHFTATPPQQRVRAVVKRYHVGEDPVVRWSGFVNRVVRKSDGAVDIICRSLLGGVKQAGIRLPWQRQCPHLIYGPGCYVNKMDHRVLATVESLDGNSLTSSGFTSAGEGRLRGGFIEWTMLTGFRAWRPVNDHGTNWLSVVGSTRGIEVGMQIAAFPSCPRTPEGCALFNNERRYGGFRHIPGQSPYDGNPVF